MQNCAIFSLHVTKARKYYVLKAEFFFCHAHLKQSIVLSLLKVSSLATLSEIMLSPSPL